MKKFVKCLIIFVILIAMVTTVFASDASGKIYEKGVSIINAVLWFGYAIALGMVIFIGIKYMLGAADAKADMKNAVKNWLIGAFIVFMATTIIGAVLNVIGTSPDKDSGSMSQDLIQKAKEVSGINE